MAKKTKKRNQPGAASVASVVQPLFTTLRNLRALKKRVTLLEQKVAHLMRSN